MAKAPRPDLDQATLEIARRMLSTPPKPHEKMRIGKAQKTARAGKTKKSSRR